MTETLQPTDREQTKRLNTMIPILLHKKLKEQASKKGRCHTVTSVLTDILQTYYAQPFDDYGNPIIVPPVYRRMYG